MNLHTQIALISILVLLILMLLRIKFIPFIRRILTIEKQLIQINKNLIEKSERNDLALRGCETAIWEWNIQKNTAYFSPYFKSILGYEENEFADTTQFFQSLLHPADLDLIYEALDDHFKKRVPYTIEYRVKCKSGNYLWFHATGQAIWDSNNQPVRMVGALTDIEMRKKAEFRLSAQFLTAQILSTATNIHDIANKMMQILVEKLEWNFGSLWLVDPSQHIIKTCGYWADGTAEFSELIEVNQTIQFQHNEGLPGRVWYTGQPLWVSDITQEHKLVRSQPLKAASIRSAFCFPVMLNNDVLGVLEFFNHETLIPDEEMLQMVAAIGAQIAQFIQRWVVEHTLRDNESYQSAIFQAASDSIMTITNEGKILTYNPRTLTIFGYSANELAQVDIDVLIPDLNRKLKNFDSKLVGDLNGIRKNGEKISVELTLARMYSQGDGSIVGIIRDISERKKIEKLKDEFVSVISQELTTQLISIKETLKLILNNAAGPVSDSAKGLLTITYRNAERLSFILQDILDIEKIQAGKMQFNYEVFNLLDVIYDVVATHNTQSSELKIQLTIKDEAKEILVKADSERLLQVLDILIKNALRFMTAMVPIDVIVERVNKKVRVSVIDDRESKPENFHDNIFQRRPSTNPVNAQDDGTALNLTICKAIIESFGGKILFASVAAKTSYYFELMIQPDSDA